jgi:CheY-like chemotaxis protein
LESELIYERHELLDLLGADDLAGNIARIRSVTQRLKDARIAASEAATAALKAKLAEHRNELRMRYAEVTDAVLDEALRSLDELAPSGEIADSDPAQLAAKLEAVDARASKAARQLDEIVAQGKVAHLVINDLVTKPITTEEELDAALERIRDAAAVELANGKQVRLG